MEDGTRSTRYEVGHGQTSHTSFSTAVNTQHVEGDENFSPEALNVMAGNLNAPEDTTQPSIPTHMSVLDILMMDQTRKRTAQELDGPDPFLSAQAVSMNVDPNIAPEADNASRGSWRLTGFYGEPDRRNRSEKRGGNPQPTWLIEGFRDAVSSSGLSDFPLQGHQFTWEKSRGKPDWIEAKLDRVLVSDSWKDKFKDAEAHTIISSKSDHLPILLKVVEAVCREVVIDSWEASRGLDLLVRIERCNEAVWKWGKVFTKNFRRKIDFWSRRMESLKRRTDHQGCMLFKEAQYHHLKALEHQNAYWRHRSKEFWLKGGDQNTTFFHNAVRRRRQNNQILRLKDDNGEWCDRGTSLNNLMLKYFSDMFDYEQDVQGPILENLGSVLSQAQNECLTSTFTTEEIKRALFDMKPDKSPGPDGLSPGFFQQYWDILGRDVVNFCETFRQTKSLPPGANNTHIVLIPKVAKPTSMTELRPIALCNVLYKILSKALANRIKPLLNCLVSESQCAFVPGRLISDNLLLAYEIQHYLKRKSQGNNGMMGLKLDMSKAYDRVNWSLVEGILSKLGFSADFVAMVSGCIRSVHYNLLLEGREIGSFIPKRGLRQGDPLSPYLFILMMECLSRLISKEIHHGSLHGVTISRGAPVISHLIFADDCFLFCRANSLEAGLLKEILKEFSAASGQSINLTKSSLIFSKNVDSLSRTVVSEILGISEGCMQGKYLGLPSLVGRRKTEILGFIKDKVLGRIKSWNNRFLSRARREILIKNVLQAIPTYAMSIFLLPHFICHKIELALNKFWWKGQSEDGKGINWKRWDELCKPKAFGGMGFQSLRAFNMALLGKQAWRFIHYPNFLVSRVFKAKNINVWKDPWLPNKSSPFVSTPMPDYLAEAKVHSLLTLQGNNWDKELLDDIFEPADTVQIMSIPIPIGNHQDRLIWNHDDKGSYTVKSAYRVICGELADIHRLPLILTVAWYIWFERNKRIWNGIKSSFSSILEEARLYFLAWQQLNVLHPHLASRQQDPRRERPALGWLKINTDAAMNTTSNMSGFGFIARDSDGLFVAAKYLSCSGIFQPRVTEALAVREALIWAKDKGFDAVCLESDAQVVIQGLGNSNSNTYFDLVLMDIHKLTSSFLNISFMFVKRSANSAAHRLAREAVFNADCREWTSSPPSFISDVILAEAV
ncbi:uncharacterized protein LOC116027009 [Ipomoea triloba]|uniref:uncharacterized protein LOC116027009 n=1 Tax=Ipomoea triloba TaxID=35885 RepID=UPI00125E44AE|nr:uncharacterized protein LOC116027009 [Ipomoea triloba]